MVKQQISLWKRNFKKGILTFGIGLCIAGMNAPAVFAAEQTGTFEGHPLFDNHFIGLEIDDSSQDSVTRRNASFAVQYDPRANGMVTKIEDQGDYNACWAFSTIAAIESNLIKKGYADSSLNLSENHLAYFFYNRQVDALGNTTGDANLSLRGSWAQNGGTIQGTALALTTWSGVVNETASEDNSAGEYQPSDLPASDCYKSDYRVRNVYFYNYNVNTIKQAIMDHGAVTSGIYIDTPYWNSKTAGYYCTKNDGNHAVAIVGWDDSYSKSNFNNSPKSNGAWIVKNSWGANKFGDNGYMYVSYEDASLTELVAFDVEKTENTYDNNYQYDGTANPAFAYKFGSGTTYANVFQAKAASGCNEVLKAVSVDVLATNVSYTIQIYSGLTSASKPTSGKAVAKQSGKFTDAGYNQVALTSPVTLAAGEKYSVVVTLYAANGGSPSLACDSSYRNDWIGFAAKTGKNQSFVKYGGKWQDLNSASTTPSNPRIKAYTDNTNVKTSYKLSCKSMGLSKGSSSTLSLKITPSSVKRNVTWSSSNKKVATVSSSGKVKAKAYGTATIKAQFAAGSSTKTLTCKVTVGPSKVKGIKVSGGKKKLTVAWKKNSAASGYTIYYSKKKNSGYKALTTITTNSKIKYTKKKMKAGTYYVKMRPYLKKGNKKLYGSYTAVKKVTVK